MQYSQYRVLWFGTLLAFLAFQMSRTAQGIVAFDLEGTNGAVGLVATGQGASMLFIAPFGGVIADRLSKRRLLLGGQTTIGLVFLILGILILTDAINIVWLTLGMFTMGVAFSFLGPARQAYVAELVPKKSLANAVALSQLAGTFARVLGPMLAGVLIGVSFISSGGTYLFMAALFVIVLATLYQLPPARPKRDISQTSVLTDLRAGIQHVRQRPRLRILVIGFIFIVMLGFPFQNILPGLTENEFGRDSTDIALLLTVSAVAGIVVSFIAAGLVTTRWAWPMMLGTGALMGGGLVLLAVAPSFGWAFPVMMLVGAGQAGFRMLNNALLLTEADPAYHGRVMSLTMIAFGIEGLSSLPIGLIADEIGERWVLGILGAATMGVVLITTIAFNASRRSQTATARGEQGSAS
jgi:MFS family permease